MEMKEINTSKVCDILNEIMEYELAGVVRYTHSSLMVSGPYRLPIVTFLKEQANESLIHAQQAGELLVGLDGHPSQKWLKLRNSQTFNKRYFRGRFRARVACFGFIQKIIGKCCRCICIPRRICKKHDWRRRAAYTRA